MSKIKRHLEDLEDLSQKSYSWQDMANFNHITQVERFNWCACEEQEQFPYEDCPREGEGER
jgi:hypothetical protein